MKMFATCVALMMGLAGPVRAEDAFAILPGFSADLDGVCGLGRDLQAGCDAIRARPILDASVPPWSAVGRVNFATTVARHHCTGVLVAPDVVLTAAHCLYRDDAADPVPVQDVTFAAGYQRGSARASAQAVRFVFAPDHDPAVPRPATDWALVVLDDAVGLDVGVLPLAATVREEPATLVGYSAIRSHVLSGAECGRVPCPAMPGDSGAPIIVGEGDALRVAAVMSSLVAKDGSIAALAIPVAAVRAALRDVAAY